MKAPDKIYLWETPIIKEGYDPAWHKNSFNDSDVEYIRKEALLEWANAQKDALFASEITDVATGLNAAYDLLISKLECL